ncbi:LacI family DNA-binding transcriptional regulator [Streptomyces sp. NPDC001046]|uniref:LacI family DNA-binding transcriptional regulator n=1 Tax=unclassified Streptomyces TaxID=2593676 RepID=UPI003643D859
MVTLRTVAEHAGVSAAVVSAAISGSSTVRMSEATRQRVLEAIRELGYVPNHAARSLKTSRTGIVATITPKISNPVFDEALRGVQDAADAHEGVVLISDSDRISPGSNLMSRLVGTGMADGFLVRFMAVDNENIAAFTARGVPCVILNGPSDGTHVCVWVDDREGIFLATDHLLELGHRRIALIGGPPTPFTADARGNGYRAAFRSRRLTPPGREWIMPGYEPHDVKTRLSSLMRRSDPPTAVVIDNVVLARGLIAAVADLGLRVPDDLSVIAYHDIPQADFYRPALSTVKMPLYEAGVRGYETLKRMIDGGQGRSATVRKPAPTIIDRGSTAPLGPT